MVVAVAGVVEAVVDVSAQAGGTHASAGAERKIDAHVCVMSEKRRI